MKVVILAVIWKRIYEEILFDNGNNAFAFEPEYPENEIQERLRAYITERDNIENVENVTAEPVENWCRCKNCVEMENVMERVCCQSSSDIIGDKMRNKTYITLTQGCHSFFENVFLGYLGYFR